MTRVTIACDGYRDGKGLGAVSVMRQLYAALSFADSLGLDLFDIDTRAVIDEFYNHIILIPVSR